MNYKETFFNILNTYFLFGLIYSGIVWLIWTFLFSDSIGVSLSFIQVFGIYVIARILVGNSSSNYTSNFYSTKPLDLDAVSKKMEEIQKQYGDDFNIEHNKNEKRD
jgi:hypothetical protein